MKPLQIGLLVVAGALAGALAMKVWQRPRSVVALPPVAARVETPTPAVGQAPTPASAAAQPVEPAPATQEPASLGSAAGPAASQPVRPEVRPRKERPASRVEAYSPPRLYRVPPAAIPEPTVVANSEPAQTAAQTPVTAAPEPLPPPVAKAPPESPTPSPTSPARTEPEQVTPVPPPPPEPHKVTLNAGLLLPVRLVDGLSTERNRPGDIFTATLDKELVVDDFVIAERGARVEGRIVASDPGGKTRGAAALSVELTKLHTSDGQVVAIRTESFARNAEQSHRDDAGKVVAGAAIGAVIGAVAGGGKGAAIGAGVGAGAGAGDVLLTRGSPVTLPSETRISFRLAESVTLTERIQ
ncbi:MAG: hypothetical protein LAQ69_00825 [Acidobacteriia bacterium]|nr:hypothetical protein [Terriglobia bacterium]